MNLSAHRILDFLKTLFQDEGVEISALEPQLFVYEYYDNEDGSALEFDPYLLSGDIDFWGLEVNELWHMSELKDGFFVLMVVAFDAEETGDLADMLLITQYERDTDNLRGFMADMDLDLYAEDAEIIDMLNHDYSRPDESH